MNALLKSTAIAAILMGAATTGMAAEVTVPSTTGYELTYDASANLFGIADDTSNGKLSWVLFGGDGGQTFKLVEPVGPSEPAYQPEEVTIYVPKVTFTALAGYQINAITFSVLGSGQGTVKSTNDGFAGYGELSSESANSFSYEVTGILTTPVTAADLPIQLENATFKFLPRQGAVGPITLLSATYTLNVSPVPEPQVLAMLMAGLGVVGFMARRRRV